MAFQTALTGLSGAQSNLDVISNNIANSNTNGFKKSRAEFADIYANSFAGSGSTQVGGGVRLLDVAQQFSQGNVEWTENSLDMAIAGEGFFTVKDTDGSLLYTRAGAFRLDREGYVVNSLGQRLQSYAVNANGLVTNLTPQDLQLTTTDSAASATTDVEMDLNLDADMSILPPGGILASDPSTYHYTTSTTIYDSLGRSHEMSVYFAKTSEVAGVGSTWEAEVYVDGVDQTPAPIAITFDTAGNLTAPLAPQTIGPFPVPGAANMQFDLDLTDTTQFAGDSNVKNVVQDGYPSGRVSSIDINDNGVVFARYTNGQSRNLGAVAVAKFASPHALSQQGDSNWAQTLDSGPAINGQAGTGDFGQIKSGALEASNVDISQELVAMIVAQRNYQANAKMISTESELTQSIMNIR